MMNELVADGPMLAGMTRIDDAPEPMTWTPQQREVFAVLEGSVRIVFADGDEVTLGVGDIGDDPGGSADDLARHHAVPRDVGAGGGLSVSRRRARASRRPP